MSDQSAMARHMGLLEYQPTAEPCADCGVPTTEAVPVAWERTERPKRFRVALLPRCTPCQWRHGLAHTEARLAAPDLHPEARPRLEAAVMWYRAVMAAHERRENGLPPAA